MKNIKGITLIALVITIVVLIIIAGVAISLSIGENGIFNKAKYASQEYANEQAREEKEISVEGTDSELINLVSNERSPINNGQCYSSVSVGYIVNPKIGTTINCSLNYYGHVHIFAIGEVN